MKKTLIALIAIFIIVAGIFFVREEVKGESESSMPKMSDQQIYDYGKAMGQYLKKRTQSDKVLSDQNNELIYLEGKDICVTQDEMDESVMYYELAGYNSSDAEERAFKHVTENAALRAKAIKEGYTATDAEVTDHINMIRSMLEGEDIDEQSKLEYAGMIDGYGDVDAYWEHEKQVYYLQLPAEKYVNDLQKDFYSDGTKSQEDWSKYFEDFKQQLVKEQEFKIAH